MHNLLTKNEVVANKKDQNIQRSIEAAACGIPESLQRHKLPEEGIKKIYKAKYKLFHDAVFSLKWLRR